MMSFSAQRIVAGALMASLAIPVGASLAEPVGGQPGQQGQSTVTTGQQGGAAPQQAQNGSQNHQQNPAQGASSTSTAPTGSQAPATNAPSDMIVTPGFGGVFVAESPAKENKGLFTSNNDIDLTVDADGHGLNEATKDVYLKWMQQETKDRLTGAKAFQTDAQVMVPGDKVKNPFDGQEIADKGQAVAKANEIVTQAVKEWDAVSQAKDLTTVKNTYVKYVTQKGDQARKNVEAANQGDSWWQSSTRDRELSGLDAMLNTKKITINSDKMKEGMEKAKADPKGTVTVDMPADDTFGEQVKEALGKNREKIPVTFVAHKEQQAPTPAQGEVKNSSTVSTDDAANQASTAPEQRDVTQGGTVTNGTGDNAGANGSSVG